MFGGGAINPYDEVVNKTTDENLTTENWELILNLCDKVADEGEEGARNVVASVLRRLAHRNPNVQLYALSLAESLSKNCGIELHREISSKAFTQGLEKLVTDRTTHEKVKRRTLSLVAMWAAEFEQDPTLGVMEDCYNSLKAKNYKFEVPQEPLPLAVDDEIRRKEEEELQRVLEMSMQDKGGRNQWSAYSAAASSSGAGGSGSSSNAGQGSGATTSEPSAVNASTATTYAQPKYESGYVPARTPSPQPSSPQIQQHKQPQQQQPSATPTGPTETSVVAIYAQGNIVTRVRALHAFEPTEPGELGFEKGDVIKVVDRGYKDWWRGQLKGRTGIFPVNYVEAMPEPTPAELAKEAEQEAAVFAQAVNVEKLLNMLRSLDPAKDNLADNEDIQELYRSSMALRPKIVKLIDKYSQKRADLVSMNETFVRARTIFDRMMEESLARHTGMYDQQGYRALYRRDSINRTSPEYIPGSTGTGPQPYGWTSNGYSPLPTTSGYPGSRQPDISTYTSTTYDPHTYAHQQQVQAQVQTPAAAQMLAAQAQAQALAKVAQTQTRSQSPQSLSTGPVYRQQEVYAVEQQPGMAYGPQGPVPYLHQAQPQVQAPAQTHHPGQQSSSQQHRLTQAQQPDPSQVYHAQQLQQQPQEAPIDQSALPGEQSASPPQQLDSLPYVYDVNATYTDPNVQAWAQYYAKGGKDPQGAVYFISVPGVKPVTASVATQSQLLHTEPQQQVQPHQQYLGRQPLLQPTPSSQMSSALPTPMSRSSVDTLPYPGDMIQGESVYGDADIHGQEAQPSLTHQSQESQQPRASRHSLQDFSGSHPDLSIDTPGSTPSWVIPRRNSPSQPLMIGRDEQGFPGSNGSSHLNNMANQFAGMSVGDSGRR